MRLVSGLISILMPGMGQVYNGRLLRGIIFLIIEHFDNMLAHINYAIYLDFNGLHEEAVASINFQYLLFYPGFYAYVIWDAWYYAKPGADKTKTAVPFVIGGFLGEFAAIYSSHLPFPTLTSGLCMIVPSITGMIIFRKQ
jgi:hypothetical protein